MTSVRFHDLANLGPDGREALLVRSEADLGSFLTAVDPIIEAVRTGGDEALADFGRRFDGADITADRIKVAPEEFAAAEAELDGAVKAAIDYATENIRRFHQRQMPEPMWMDQVRPNVLTGEKTVPIPSVACYVPRGKGSFPSMVMMSLVPARVAGVRRVIMLTPPGPAGEVDAASLYAARCAGVEEVYRCGGAQAVAAVAHGTETVPRVAKIVGPGSPWLIAAKQRLVDRIDPGPPAGPSESIVLAEGGTDPRLAAMDLIVESEHGDDSSAFLVTDDRILAEAVCAEIPKVWAELGEQRAGYSAAVLGGDRGGVVLAPDWDAAIDFVNDYAPEHLLILSADPFAHIHRIENAGEMLLGETTPLPLGNFVLGPNAILPTSGHARTYSPLGVHDFLKRISIAHVGRGAYGELARHAETLARYEGFEGHAYAVSEARRRIIEARD